MYLHIFIEHLLYDKHSSRNWDYTFEQNRSYSCSYGTYNNGKFIQVSYVVFLRIMLLLITYIKF